MGLRLSSGTPEHRSSWFRPDRTWDTRRSSGKLPLSMVLSQSFAGSWCGGGSQSRTEPGLGTEAPAGSWLPVMQSPGALPGPQNQDCSGPRPPAASALFLAWFRSWLFVPQRFQGSGLAPAHGWAVPGRGLRRMEPRACRKEPQAGSSLGAPPGWPGPWAEPAPCLGLSGREGRAACAGCGACRARWDPVPSSGASTGRTACGGAGAGVTGREAAVSKVPILQEGLAVQLCP